MGTIHDQRKNVGKPTFINLFAKPAEQLKSLLDMVDIFVNTWCFRYNILGRRMRNKLKYYRKKKAKTTIYYQNWLHNES